MWVWVNAAEQNLKLMEAGYVRKTYSVSTGLNGLGEQLNSYQTPRGWHIVRAKIGGGAPIHSVFRGRRPTGEYYTPELGQQYPERDWILSRILWLSGLQKGVNRLGSVDTMRRYIYIHGTPESEPMGVAKSHGCVRMHNADVLDLYERIPVGTRVYISADDDGVRDPFEVG